MTDPIRVLRLVEDRWHQISDEEVPALVIGPSIGKGDSITIRRDRIDGEGSRDSVLSIGIRGISDAGLKPSSIRRVDHFIRETVRRRRRERTIREFDREYRSDDVDPPPAWSVTAHRMTALLMRHHASQDLIERVNGDMRGRRRVLADRIVLGTCGRAGKWPVMEICQHGCDVIRISENMIPGMRIRDGSRYKLSFGVDMPETVMHSIVGMDVGDVIGHPAFGGAVGIRIDEAWHDESDLRIVLENVMEPLSEAPRGADVSWRTAT